MMVPLVAVSGLFGIIIDGIGALHPILNCFAAETPIAPLLVRRNFAPACEATDCHCGNPEQLGHFVSCQYLIHYGAGVPACICSFKDGAIYLPLPSGGSRGSHNREF
jgi:hypothetical protein